MTCQVRLSAANYESSEKEQADEQANNVVAFFFYVEQWLISGVCFVKFSKRKFDALVLRLSGSIKERSPIFLCKERHYVSKLFLFSSFVCFLGYYLFWQLFKWLWSCILETSWIRHQRSEMLKEIHFCLDLPNQIKLFSDIIGRSRSKKIKEKFWAYPRARQ